MKQQTLIVKMKAKDVSLSITDGNQDDGHKDEKSYARAIRRVPITQDRHGHHR